MTDADPSLAAEPGSPTLDLEILSGAPTVEEIAAVTAVLSAMTDDLADDARLPDGGPSAWERSQRSLRQPIVPGPLAWRGFTV